MMNIRWLSVSATLLLIGAGCTSSVTTPVLTSETFPPALQQEVSTEARINVPELGFSYVSIQESKNLKEDNAEVKGSRLNWGDGTIDFIEQIQRKNGTNFSDSVHAFALAHGASDELCTFQTSEVSDDGTYAFLDVGTHVISIVPKKSYEPSKAEINAYLRTPEGGHAGVSNSKLSQLCENGPECTFATINLKMLNAKSQCGEYVSPQSLYHSIGFFASPSEERENILFIFSTEGSGGGAPPFYTGKIQFHP